MQSSEDLIGLELRQGKALPLTAPAGVCYVNMLTSSRLKYYLVKIFIPNNLETSIRCTITLNLFKTLILSHVFFIVVKQGRNAG